LPAASSSMISSRKRCRISLTTTFVRASSSVESARRSG
jgi:hypothetical protein